MYRLLIVALNLMVLILLVIETVATPSFFGIYSILMVASFFNLVFAIFSTKVNLTVIQTALIYPVLQAFSYFGNAVLLYFGGETQHSEGFISLGGYLIVTAVLGILFVYETSQTKKENNQLLCTHAKNAEDYIKQGKQYKNIGRCILFLQLCLIVWLWIVQLKHPSPPHAVDEGFMALIVFVLLPLTWLGTSIRNYCDKKYKKCMEDSGILPETKGSWFSNSKFIRLLFCPTGMLGDKQLNFIRSRSIAIFISFWLLAVLFASVLYYSFYFDSVRQ